MSPADEVWETRSVLVLVEDIFRVLGFVVVAVVKVEGGGENTSS